MKHKNPYRVNDPNNLFEVGENSSHPELEDARRVYKFKAYSFNSATELEKFFMDEGLNPAHYTIEPVIKRNYEHGKSLIIINVVAKSESRNERAVKNARY